MALDTIEYEMIRQLYGKYSLAVDYGDEEAFAACFTPTAVYEFGGLPEEAERNGAHTGTEQLKKLARDIYAGNLGHSRHWLNPVTIEGDGDRATVVAYAMVLRAGITPKAGVTLTAMVTDQVVRFEGRWVFDHRYATMDPQLEHAVESQDVLVRQRDAVVAFTVAAMAESELEERARGAS